MFCNRAFNSKGKYDSFSFCFGIEYLALRVSGILLFFVALYFSVERIVPLDVVAVQRAVAPSEDIRELDLDKFTI